MTGTIKMVNRERGFGFIKGENGAEYFFHRSGVLGAGVFEDLVEDMAVTFDEEPSAPKGPRARHVEMRDSVTA